MEIFEKYLNRTDDFLKMLQLHHNVTLYERESVVIFDEVQQYPKARAAIKYLVAHGKYDYIETGSLVRIKKNVKDIVIPSEEKRMVLNPMDFEEFLWAIRGCSSAWLSTRTDVSPMRFTRKYCLENWKETYVLYDNDYKVENGVVYMPLYMACCL